MTKKVFAALVLCCLFLASGAFAEETQPPMSPEMEAMMAAWEKAMKPGSQHEMLASSAGDWTFTLTYWMEAGSEPSTSTGTAKREVLHGGRVVQETVTGEFAGQPFHGLAFTGYDNVAGKFWSTWTDNMSTGLLVTYGTLDEATQSMTFKGEVPDPMGSGMVKMRIVSKTDSAGHEVSEFYEQRGSDPERKTMEMVYQRAK